MKPWQKKPDAPKRRLGGSTWQAMRRKVFADQHGFCAACGRTMADWHMDHITPLSKGGSETRENFQGLCIQCHEKKSAADKGHKYRPRVGVDGYPVED